MQIVLTAHSIMCSYSFKKASLPTLTILLTDFLNLVIVRVR